MTIYIDTNVYNRPFDDLSKERILEETHAFMEIFSHIVAGTIKCISSDILKLEIQNTSDKLRRERVLDYLIYCSYNVCQDESIMEFAKDIKTKCGLSNRDALHIASACKAKASFFLTCDDELVKKARSISKALQTKGYNIII